jgi:hypothetical protein
VREERRVGSRGKVEGEGRGRTVSPGSNDCTKLSEARNKSSGYTALDTRREEAKHQVSSRKRGERSSAL